MLGVSSQGLSLPRDCNIRMFAWTSRWHRGQGASHRSPLKHGLLGMTLHVSLLLESPCLI